MHSRKGWSHQGRRNGRKCVTFMVRCSKAMLDTLVIFVSFLKLRTVLRLSVARLELQQTPVLSYNPHGSLNLSAGEGGVRGEEEVPKVRDNHEERAGEGDDWRKKKEEMNRNKGIRIK